MVFILLYLSMHVMSLVIFKLQQERAYSGISLACLEIRSRNEEASNFTRNRVFTSYFIDVDTFYLFLN